jgi:uncharacterized protein YbjT (DUF2867 family)
MSGDSLPCVAVAGATGFLGSALGQALQDQVNLIGLTRSDRAAIDHYAEVRRVDLFSKTDTVRALKGVDYAVYLVHSMMPSARLVQSSFEDLDLLCAENFAQAAAENGVRHIVYVGGLQPSSGVLSRHLESRVEVERVLGGHGVSVTTLRAGLIVGGNGSSFQILRRLIERLPVMVCPSWTNTKTNPVALSDVIWAIGSVLQNPGSGSRVFDVGAPEPLSYRELMATTARLMGVSRWFLPVPLVTPALSGLWVSLVTGAPKALVGPLILSLRHEMLARMNPEYRLPGEPSTPIEDTLREALQDGAHSQAPPRAFGRMSSASATPKVLSVQRMKIPRGRDAAWAATLYMRWLPDSMYGLMPITVSQHDNQTLFRLWSWGPVLLHLERTTSVGRQVFRIIGGVLARPSEKGRFEFRTVLDGQTLIVAIHEYAPRLPWWIYCCSQALLHQWVMHRFGQFIGEQEPTS